MSDRHALAPGTMLRQYKIESVLGQGGFGITYLAYDTDLQRKVAIKECFPRDFVSREGTNIVPTSGGENQDFSWALGKFVDEATTLARFRHPGIVQVLQILKEENNTACMVLEFIDGQSLEQWLKIRPQPPTETEIKRVLTPMIDALQVVHENGIVHRDIAPDNIYIRKNGQAVLLDFGAAKQIFGQHSRTMNLIVKDGYSAPEQYYAEGRQGAWTDIYAFAAVIYRAITGKKPVDAMARLDAINNGEPDPIIPLSDKAREGYSPNFLAAVSHGLAPQVKSRPQSLAQWRSMLLGNEAQAPAAKTQPQQKAKATSKKPGKGFGKMIAAAASIAAIGVGGFFVWQQTNQADPETVWAATAQQDTIAAYDEFIRNYPESPRRSQAVAAKRAFSQPWSKTVGTAVAERANAVTTSKDMVVVAGAITKTGDDAVQGLIQAFSLAGREKWRAEFGQNGNQSFNDVMFLADGDIIAAGVTKPNPSQPSQAFVVRIDPEGKEKWTKNIEGSSGGGILALAPGNDGGILAAGYSASGPNGNDDGWLVALNGFGDRQWERFSGGPANDSFHSITRLTGGEIALAGERGGNFWLLKQGVDGTTLVDRRPGGANRDVFMGVIGTQGGEILAVGQTESFGTQTVDGMIMKLTTDGKMPPKVLAEARDDHLTSAIIAADGGILVAGYTSSRGAGQTDGWVRKYDSQLSRVLWERVVGGKGWETIHDIDLLPDNSIVLSGSSDSSGAGSSDVWLVRMGADGQYADN